MKRFDFIKKAQRKLLDEHRTDMCYVRIDEIISVFEDLGMFPPLQKTILTKAYTKEFIEPVAFWEPEND